MNSFKEITGPINLDNSGEVHHQAAAEFAIEMMGSRPSLGIGSCRRTIRSSGDPTSFGQRGISTGGGASRWAESMIADFDKLLSEDVA